MLTVIAARKTGGVFSPPIEKENRGDVSLIYIKNRKALKKLKKMDCKKILAAPSAVEAADGFLKEYKTDNENLLPLLPRILGSLAPLPVGELYLAMDDSEKAAQIIDICVDCAKLFTVVSRKTGGEETFDRLYFNKGIIMRRIPAADSRIGATALCITDGGRSAPGVVSVDAGRLDRVRFYGGSLDFLEEALGIMPTAGLYGFAGLPLPENGKISINYGDKILYLDSEEIM